MSAGLNRRSKQRGQKVLLEIKFKREKKRKLDLEKEVDREDEVGEKNGMNATVKRRTR